jgi:hypothetical protein
MHISPMTTHTEGQLRTALQEFILIGKELRII